MSIISKKFKVGDLVWLDYNRVEKGSHYDLIIGPSTPGIIIHINDSINQHDTSYKVFWSSCLEFKKMLQQHIAFYGLPHAPRNKKTTL